MALHRGIQSAVFYYLSCAPCADARYRKKRKEEAAQDRADWEQLEAQMPNLYRHPSPSSTNPYWQAEIAMGPSLPRGKRKTHTQGSERGLKTSAPQSSNGSKLPSSVDLPHDGSNWDDRLDSGWNLKQYQREDEQLWGSASAELPLRSHLSDQSSASKEPTRPPKAKTKYASSSSSASTYKEYRNPQVNELHPAIATRVSTRAEVAWMLQPPPVAEVMNGKERASRSRSNSGLSRPSTNGSASLPRQAGPRMTEDKLQASDSNLSRQRSSRSGRSGRSIPDVTEKSHDSLNVPTRIESSELAGSTKRKERTKPPCLPSGKMLTESDKLAIAREALDSESPKLEQSRKLASRPQLSTILSEATVSSVKQSEPITSSDAFKENSVSPARFTQSDQYSNREETSRQSELVVNDPSFKLLPASNKSALAFNTQILAVTQSPGGEMLHVPGVDGGENDEHAGERRNTGGPELFDTWYTPDFELDKWVHEHTKREVKQRWSMDI